MVTICLYINPGGRKGGVEGVRILYNGSVGHYICNALEVVFFFDPTLSGHY